MSLYPGWVLTHATLRDFLEILILIFWGFLLMSSFSTLALLHTPAFRLGLAGSSRRPLVM